MRSKAGTSHAERRQKRHLAWFNIHRQAVALTWPHVGPVCICVLCQRGGGLEAKEAFTFEDVPPKSVGGRPVVLTCVDCNSRAGELLNVHMQREQNIKDFGRGELKRPRPARLRVGGSNVEVNVQNFAGNIKVFGVPQCSAPDELAAHLKELDRCLGAGATGESRIHIDLYRDAFIPQRARVGWLLSAYLLAFAAFGYRYAFNGALAGVREQVISPDSEVLRRFRITVPDSTGAERSLLLVREPEHLRGFAVRFGANVILLPTPGDTAFYERLGNDRGRGANLRGVELEWPRRPTFAYDFGRLPKARAEEALSS